MATHHWCGNVIRGSGRGRRAAHARGKVLGDVGDAAFEWDLAGRRIASDNVGLCTDNMEDDVVGEISSEFHEPYAHIGE